MKIASFEKCTGCSACASVCPAGAIQMRYKKDSGFCYPSVEKTKCINCGKCSAVCPVNNAEAFFSEQKRCYIGQDTDILSLKTATSGGMASALSRCFVKREGVVYGAAFCQDMQLKHIRCVTEQDCERIKGSKYVQSDLSDIFERMSEDLRKQIPVLFIGTPCQCAAVKHLFGKYPHFYCCDFVCNGVASPVIFQKHLKKLEALYRCKIDSYVFRPKVEMYLEPYEMFSDTKGKTYRIKSPWKKWGSIYYAALAMRTSCFDCPFSKAVRIGDLTFSDIPAALMQNGSLDTPHSISRLGASLLSVNDSKGELLLEMVAETVYLKETEMPLTDKNKHVLHDIRKRDDFCREAENSFEKAKYHHLGLQVKIKGSVIDWIEYWRRAGKKRRKGE